MNSMWMGELARRSGVPVATVKYYLREGLLPPGEATGATRASYDERHVRRLVLIRALTGVAGMSLGQVREVLDVIDDAGTDVATAMGAAHLQLSPAPAEPAGGVSCADAVAGAVRPSTTRRISAGLRGIVVRSRTASTVDVGRRFPRLQRRFLAPALLRSRRRPENQT